MQSLPKESEFEGRITIQCLQVNISALGSASCHNELVLMVTFEVALSEETLVVVEGSVRQLTS